MCVNNLSKAALDSAGAGIEPVTSSRKSNALTTTPPSHTPSPRYVNNRVVVLAKMLELSYGIILFNLSHVASTIQ